MRYLHLVAGCFVLASVVTALPKGIDCDLQISHDFVFVCRFLPPASRDGSCEYFFNTNGNNSSEDRRCNATNKCDFSRTRQELRITLQRLTLAYERLWIVVRRLKERIAFEVKPCEYETVRFSYSATKGREFVDFNWTIKKPSSHSWENYQLRARCESVGGQVHEKNFTGKADGIVQGLRAFTSYNCSLHARYIDTSLSTCDPKWSSAKPILLRTLGDLPDAGPVFYDGMYQREETFCHIYFLPVPREQRNGRVDRYRCRDGPESDSLHLRLDCPHDGSNASCQIQARTADGWGRASTPATAEWAERPRPELELWRTEDASLFVPRLVLPSPNVNRENATLLVCKCSDCARPHPDCTALTTQPLVPDRPLRLDLGSQVVAALVSDAGRRPMPMSAWVGCAHGRWAPWGAEATAAVARRARVRDWCDADACRVEVRVPAAALRCLRRSVRALVSRVECPLGRTDRWHERAVGRREVRLVVVVPRGCTLQLSPDSGAFATVFRRPKRVPVLLIVGLIFVSVVAVLALSFFAFLWRRGSCRRAARRLRAWRADNFGPVGHLSAAEPPRPCPLADGYEEPGRGEELRLTNNEWRGNGHVPGRTNFHPNTSPSAEHEIPGEWETRLTKERDARQSEGDPILQTSAEARPRLGYRGADLRDGYIA